MKKYRVKYLLGQYCYAVQYKTGFFSRWKTISIHYYSSTAVAELKILIENNE